MLKILRTSISRENELISADDDKFRVASSIARRTIGEKVHRAAFIKLCFPRTRFSIRLEFVDIY